MRYLFGISFFLRIFAKNVVEKMIYIWFYLVCVFIMSGYCTHRAKVLFKRGHNVNDLIVALSIGVILAPMCLLFVIGSSLSANLFSLNEKIFKH